MRILALNYEFPPLGGGAGNATAHISRELSRMGCTVAVLTSGFRGLPGKEVVDGYTVYRIPVVRRHIERCSPPEMASFVLAALCPTLTLVRRFKPEILHVYFGVPTGPVGLVAKAVTGIPYLLSLRGGDVPGFLPASLNNVHRLLAPLTRWVWENAAVVVANSGGLAGLAQKRLPSRTVETVPNGIDLAEYSPEAFSRRDGPLRLLFVGRLVEQKGVGYILRALPEVRARTGMPLELTVIGSGPQEGALRQLAREVNAEPAVRFLGWAHRREMPGHYRDADIFVFPSFEEGMSNAVLEAMASGLPIVASDIYGNRELVTEGENGLLVPPADAPALTEAVARLAADAHLRHAMGRRSREKAERYRWDQTARAYLELSRQALDGKTGPGKSPVAVCGGP